VTVRLVVILDKIGKARQVKNRLNRNHKSCHVTLAKHVFVGFFVSFLNYCKN